MRFVLLPLVAAAVLAAAASAAPGEDGGIIVFERRTGTGVADIWSVRADGTGLRRLTRTQDNFDPDVSPDGRFVVFASSRAQGAGAAELFVMRVDGAEVRRLTRHPRTRRAFRIDADPAWSSDGETIVFSRTFVRGGRSSTDLFSVPATGGAPTRLTYTAGQEVSPTFSVSLDIAFVRNGFVYQRVGSGQIKQHAGEDPDYAGPPNYWGAFSRDGAVYRHSFRGEIRVGAGTDPAWSPDGTRLAWVTPLGLVVDGKRITRTTNPVHHLSPSWGPAR